MQLTFFSFVMSLLWFNLYIILINFLRKKDNFIISFTTFPLIFFLFLSMFRLIFNFEVPGAIIIKSKKIFTELYHIIRKPLNLEGFRINVFQILILIWGSIAIILLVNNIIEYIKFKKTLEVLDEGRNKENEHIFNKVLNQMKVAKKIEIIQHDSIGSPFILGILNGKIYIPNIKFTNEELEYIISHEINHFKSKDSLKKVFIQIIKYIFWWNPSAHLFANNFNHILEIQCDLKTTSGFSEEEKIEYLEVITRIIKGNVHTESDIKPEYTNIPNFVGIEELSSLKQRFRIVLNYKSKLNMSKKMNIVLYILSLLLFISSYLIIIQPDYEPTSNEIYEKTDESNSFILENPDGSYDIYIDNIFKYNVEDLNELNKDFRNLPIMRKE